MLTPQISANQSAIGSFGPNSCRRFSQAIARACCLSAFVRRRPQPLPVSFLIQPEGVSTVDTPIQTRSRKMTLFRTDKKCHFRRTRKQSGYQPLIPHRPSERRSFAVAAIVHTLADIWRSPSARALALHLHYTAQPVSGERPAKRPAPGASRRATGRTMAQPSAPSRPRSGRTGPDCRLSRPRSRFG